MTRRASGFSLLEMAFVLIIVTLLLGGLLVPFATQVEQKRIVETQKAMEEIKEALIGYALSRSSTATPTQPYLPCPDAFAGATISGINLANDGQEDRNTTTGACDQTEGNLPWVTLGIGQADPWGAPFFYRVTPDFANSTTGFGLTTLEDIVVCSSSAAPGCPAANRLADTLPVVVLSFGKNGQSFACPSPGRGDECENRDADANFVSRVITKPSSPCGNPGQPLCEFDDLVTWLSPNVLFNRMVAAGRLP